MNHRIKINKAQARAIVEATFPNYKGRKFSVEFAETITFCDTNWSGGTRNFYYAHPNHLPKWLESGT